MSKKPVTYTTPTHRYWRDTTNQIADVVFDCVERILDVPQIKREGQYTEGDMYALLASLYAANMDLGVKFEPIVLHGYSQGDTYPGMRFVWPDKIRITWAKDSSYSQWTVDIEHLDNKDPLSANNY